jgi:hypothetical protein
VKRFFIVIVVLAALGAVIHVGQSPLPVAQRSTVTSETTPSRNLANDRLRSLPRGQQATVLGKVVGEGCVGTSAFFMGIGDKGFGKDKAFWSIRCRNGKTYEVEINPDSTGSTGVLECSVLKTITGTECFKNLN